MKRSKLTITLLAAALFMFSVWWALAAAPSNTISYQGYLTDNSGTPIEGSRDMQVVLFTAVSGGTGVYTETHSAVTVSQGQFNLQLGSGTSSGNWSNDIDFSQALWLEITIDPVGAPETLSPRVALSTVPYARFAFAIADNAVTPTKLNGITGNGTGGQVLSSDGSGGFSWANAGGGGLNLYYYSTTASVPNSSNYESVYVGCTQGTPISGSCEMDFYYGDCPATSAGNCATSNPTGWSCRTWGDGSSVTAFVVCAE